MRCTVLLLLAAVATSCGSRHAARVTTDAPAGAPAASTAAPWPAPGRALPRTVRIAVSTGSGARRLALWTGRSASGSLCVGAAVGAARPQLECLRRGLEPPVLGVEGGGGRGPRIGWSALVGLASTDVRRVAAGFQTGAQPLGLTPSPVRGRRALRSTIHVDAGVDAVEATDRAGRKVLDEAGLWLGSRCNPDTVCGRRGGAWSEVRPLYVADSSGREGEAIRLALAVPGVAALLHAHPSWLASADRWGKCNGSDIGYAVAFEFRRPATYRARLPYIANSQRPFAYLEGVHEVAVIGGTQLLVWVDTNRRKAVGVETAYEDGVTIPLHVVQRARPGGGPDTPNCFAQGD